MTHSIVVSEHDFDIAEQYDAVAAAAPHSGAIVFFVGLVRDYYSPDSTSSVSHIELEHYPGMTEALCQQIIEQARQRFEFDYASVYHRIGKLKAGEQIVFVAVANRHRESAFQAAQFIMDYLKTRATFWKKEVGDRGQQWLGVKEQDKLAANRWVANKADDKINH